jgi:hypothetical protein
MVGVELDLANLEADVDLELYPRSMLPVKFHIQFRPLYPKETKL